MIHTPAQTGHTRLCPMTIFTRSEDHHPPSTMECFAKTFLVELILSFRFMSVVTYILDIFSPLTFPAQRIIRCPMSSLFLSCVHDHCQTIHVMKMTNTLVLGDVKIDVWSDVLF